MTKDFKENVTVTDRDGNIVFKLNRTNGQFVVTGRKDKDGDILVKRVNKKLFHFNGSSCTLSIGAENNEGNLVIKDGKERKVFNFDAKNSYLTIGAKNNEGDIKVIDGKEREVFNFDAKNSYLTIGAKGNEGDIKVRDSSGNDAFHFNAKDAYLTIGTDGNEGDLAIKDGSGKTRIHLDGKSGDIKLTGADCAENFKVGSSEIEPGTVLVINENGNLNPCSVAYDSKVAGIVSGAKGFSPGIILDSDVQDEECKVPVALTGKAFCKADASYSPIEVGNLLTTSNTIGYAMKADLSENVFGTTIGKALQPLKEGKGMIPVLVSLQ